MFLSLSNLKSGDGEINVLPLSMLGHCMIGLHNVKRGLNAMNIS